MMPNVDGLRVCKVLRAEKNRIPILMLTARNRPEDVLRGFEMGADDYVSKPFNPRVLLARLRAVLRRAHGAGVQAAQSFVQCTARGDDQDRGAIALRAPALQQGQTAAVRQTQVQQHGAACARR